MNEPRVEQWMRDAAWAIDLLINTREETIDTMAKAIAQHAPPDVHSLLSQLSQDAKTAVMLLTPTPEGRKWICHPFGYADGKGDSIPAAISAAREAMGR